MMIVEGG